MTVKSELITHWCNIITSETSFKKLLTNVLTENYICWGSITTAVKSSAGSALVPDSVPLICYWVTKQGFTDLVFLNQRLGAGFIMSDILTRYEAKGIQHPCVHVISISKEL